MTTKKSPALRKCPSCKEKKSMTGFQFRYFGAKGRRRADVCADCAKQIDAKGDEKRMETCLKCGQMKHVSEFYKNRIGYQGYCKPCRAKAIADGAEQFAFKTRWEFMCQTRWVSHK